MCIRDRGFYSLMFLAQALAEENLPRPLHLTVVTTGAAQVKSERLSHPEKATILGPLRVIPRELPGVTVTSLDVILPEARKGLEPLAAQVLEDMLAEPATAVLALRGARRFAQGLKPVALPEADFNLPQGAHVLITGGFGGIGLTLAEDMIRCV